MNEEEREAGRKLFTGPCDFVLGVASSGQFPESSLPEVAFAGRSNVGKSSLVNALTGRKTLAKTSGTPGRTQQLNYFKLGGRLYMVDMPGYGYAAVSKTEKEKWSRLIKTYLSGRKNLRCVFILVDSRHGLKSSDQEIMTMLDQAAVAYRIVLTKCDKIHESDLEKLMTGLQKELKNHTAAFPDTISTSAREGRGIEELRTLIARSF